MTVSELKYLRSLSHQKYRKEHNAYIVEGDKLVKEWIIAQEDLQYLVATEEWMNKNASLIEKLDSSIIKNVPYHQLEKISSLKTPPNVLACVRSVEKEWEIENNEWVIILDAIQDPGNLGTIIRIADWFGIKNIIALPGTVESYNPKVIQSSMGSMLRLSVHYMDWTTLKNKFKLPLYATTLEGKNIYENKPQKSKGGGIILGNESNGISSEILKEIDHQIMIPKIGNAESLNVAVACGIICSAILSE